MAKLQKIDNTILRRLCDIIADTNEGLTNSQIGNLLKDCEMEDISPSMNKRTRLFDALENRQKNDNCGNNVVNFFQNAMNPVNYISSEELKELFDSRITELNKILLLNGFQLNKNGKFIKVQKAKNIEEAEIRANELRKKLQNRNVHPEILKFCKKELLQDNNYFHSVLEASKSIADRIRNLSGLKSDGSKLFDEAFSLGKLKKPKLAFNTLSTESEESEHKGFVHLCKGIFGLVRNLTAHEPKIKRKMNEEEALDNLVIISRIHKILDNTVPTGL